MTLTDGIIAFMNSIAGSIAAINTLAKGLARGNPGDAKESTKDAGGAEDAEETQWWVQAFMQRSLLLSGLHTIYVMRVIAYYFTGINDEQG